MKATTDENDSKQIDYSFAEELSDCLQLDSRRYDTVIKEDE